jgi:hypothetical protein
LFLTVLVVLTGCDSKSGGQFSKSDCDMKLTTAIWYVPFDKGTYSKAELLIGSTIAAYKLSGFELDEKELRYQSNVVLDVGTGQFKEKAIPACVEKVDLHFVNRSQGERKTECFAEAYTNDKEFGMFRNIKVMRCDELDTEMPKWMTEHLVRGMKYQVAVFAPTGGQHPVCA